MGVSPWKFIYTKSFEGEDDEKQIAKIPQGGLITSEFRDFITSPKRKDMPHEYKDIFFSDMEVYRGGMIMCDVGISEVLQMFDTQMGITTAYRPLREDKISLMSVDKVKPESISESMEYYNSMMAMDFLRKYHSSNNAYYSFDTPHYSFGDVVIDHIKEGMYLRHSPFVSTSEDYGASRVWSNKFSADYGKGSNYSFLLTAALPTQGCIRMTDNRLDGIQNTFEAEREILVTGGLAPESIRRIQIFHKNNPEKPLYEASREGATVTVVDGRGEHAVKKRYQYDGVLKLYTLLDEEVLEEAGTSLVQKEEEKKEEVPEPWV